MLRASMGAVVASEQPDVLACIGKLVYAGLANATQLIAVSNCDLRNFRPQLRMLRALRGAPGGADDAAEDEFIAEQGPLAQETLAQEQLGHSPHSQT
jgi:hypothetical protein